MAEFALGLTNTAVAGTVSRVKSAIEEEADIKERVQEDLEFITGEFQMMQSVLRGANTADRAAKNQVVRTWVKQLRDLAFDVEDCVDFIVHLDSPPWTNWLWRVLPSCCKAGAPPLPLDEAVAEIKRLKTRVQDVSQRNTRYNLMIDSTPAMAAVQQIMLPAPTTTTTLPLSAAGFNILREVWQAAGKLHSTGTTLTDLMRSDEGNELQVVSLWPGSHSTCADLHLSEVSCLIREAYNDPQICSNFEALAWVKLTTPHPAAAFNRQEILNSLVAQFCPSLPTDQLAAGKAELMLQVNTKKYLVIIQGISTVVEWDAIKMYLPDNNNGSRIIVSTQQLRTALLCTGDPYKVAELARFSDGQSLSAFTKVSMIRRHVGEFIWQLRRGGVISLLGDLNHDTYSCRGNKSQIFLLYKLVMYKHKDMEGVLMFKEQSWVSVPNPFDLEAFCVQLFLNFQSCDFQAKEIAEVGLEGVAERCRKYLVEGDCLVVINGLQSTDDWDMIRKTLLFSDEPIAKGTSIVVITKEESVAAYCADQKNPSLDIKDVEDDMALHRLTKNSKSCGIGGKEVSHRARLLFHDPDDAFEWTCELRPLGRENEEMSALEREIKKAGVISVLGDPGVGKSAIVKKVYYEKLYSSIYYIEEAALTVLSWVDVPADRPFDLTDFAWHLLLGFYSRDLESKERAAVDMLRGLNPVKQCCQVLKQVLRQKNWLVVIDGLRSERDWEEIKATFLSSEPAATLQGCIVVITDKKEVARHCTIGEEKGRVVHVKGPLAKCPPGHTYERGGDAHGSAAEFEFVGRDQEKAKLFWALRNDPCLFSLWGVAGVGKSALVRHLYNWYITTLNRSIKHSWVDVPDPFDLSDFSQRLLLGFHSDDLQSMEIAAVSIIEGHDTVHGSCTIMQETCLIVIDGLRSTHEWDLIRAAFLSDTNQVPHRIIVITNEASIATHCVHDKDKVLNVKGLNAADALCLFQKIAWCGKQQLTSEEKEFSEAIVDKCGGFPEVIAAIAEYTAEKIADMGRDNKSLRSISQEIHHDFICKLENDSRFQSLRSLFCWMQSYFVACPDSLKPCIFYLSVFPVGHKIRQRRLLRRWIAEGYSTDTSSDVTAEDNAEILFAELVKSSIIQQQEQAPSSSGNFDAKIVVQVNGFYHGYIMSRPMEDNLVFALEERCSINSQRAGQHLTIRSTWDRDKVVYQSIDFTRLRSLTVFGEWKPFFISVDYNMRLLRVLDLEDTTSGVTDDVLEQIGKLLPRLKFLSLRGCKDISRIPDSFGGLRQLQTLDVRNTKIVTLPHTIIKLVKLQYIRAGPISGEGDDEDDCPSTTSEDGWIPRDGMITSQPAASVDDGGTSTSHRGARSSEGTGRAEATILYCGDTEETTEIRSDDMSTNQRPVAAEDDDTCKRQAAAAAADSDVTAESKRVVEVADNGCIITSQSTTLASDGTIKLAAETIDGDGTLATQPTTAYGGGTSKPPEVDSNDTSRHLLEEADGDGAITGQPATANSDDASTGQPEAATIGGDGTSQPAAADGDETSRTQPIEHENRASITRDPWRRKAHDVVVSYYRCCLSRKKKSPDNNWSCGVEIPAAALGKLTSLHTLGIINLGGAHGKASLNEIQKLTQLRKLRVSGINRKKLEDLCLAISGHGHLVSFSMRLDKLEDAASVFSSSDSMFTYLPKTLKSLKIYTWDGHGSVRVPPGLIKQLGNQTKVNLELKISTQEDIDNLVELPNTNIFRHPYLKLTEDGELCYGWWVGG